MGTNIDRCISSVYMCALHFMFNVKSTSSLSRLYKNNPTKCFLLQVVKTI